MTITMLTAVGLIFKFDSELATAHIGFVSVCLLICDCVGMQARRLACLAATADKADLGDPIETST